MQSFFNGVYFTENFKIVFCNAILVMKENINRNITNCKDFINNLRCSNKRQVQLYLLLIKSIIQIDERWWCKRTCNIFHFLLGQMDKGKVIMYVALERKILCQISDLVLHKFACLSEKMWCLKVEKKMEVKANVALQEIKRLMKNFWNKSKKNLLEVWNVSLIVEINFQTMGNVNDKWQFVWKGVSKGTAKYNY